MTGWHQDIDANEKRATRRPTWLPVLENELKRPVGWVDEAVSPFARSKPAQQTQAKLRHAA
jgi:hypothetical protein